MERRRHKRLDLSAPIKFEWESPDQAPLHRTGTGITLNFSAGGLFVMTDQPPPLGSTVQFEVDLGTERSASSVNIGAKGIVSRIEPTALEGRVGGFAISTRRMRLRKPGLR